ncbi:hypothetical protein MP638_002247 [Amoeboaphelidium occidentale]|nr:hypothetical protein MP638_002247 [Amoeboaphelidium occidentale]
MGVGATCAAWFMMVRHRKDRIKLNQYARLRITLQGFTFGAVLYALYKDGRGQNAWSEMDAARRNR